MTTAEKKQLDDDGLALIFRNARTHNVWLSTSVPEATLRAIWDVIADGKLKVNFVCSLGHGDASKLFPRSPRLDFDEACRIA